MRVFLCLDSIIRIMNFFSFILITDSTARRKYEWNLYNVERLQELLNNFANEDIYIHLETTNGAYAAHFNENVFNAGAFIRNVMHSL